MALITKPLRTETSKQQAYYADFNTSFSFDISKMDLYLITNEQSVMRSIKNIILTRRGEKFFNPLFGCDLQALLFEPMSPVTEALIKDSIITSVRSFEPRANLLDVVVSPYYDQNAYVISVVFSIINKKEPIVLELLVNRIR